VARRREGACSSERKHDRTEQEQNERQKKDEDGERIRNVVPAHKENNRRVEHNRASFFYLSFYIVETHKPPPHTL